MDQIHHLCSGYGLELHGASARTQNLACIFFQHSLLRGVQPIYVNSC